MTIAQLQLAYFLLNLMFKQKTSDKQKSSQNSTTCLDYAKKESLESRIVFSLQPTQRRYRPKQATQINQQNSCKTQRSTNESRESIIELVFNDKFFQIDCSESNLVESQLQKIFSDYSVKQNIRRSITIIILERAQRLNNNIVNLFEKNIEVYQNAQLEVIQTKNS